MAIDFARRLIGRARSQRSDRQLGCLLAFVAGATNAGGFLAVHQYTSHMTGIVSSMADNLAIGVPGLVFDGIGALVSFVVGASVTAVLVNFARQRDLESVYALPLLLESMLLLVFGVIGAQLTQINGLFVSVTVMLLCFIMGIQNALITKLSRAEIRTTHVTGIVTDIGIELGKLVYWNATRSPGPSRIRADRNRLTILSLLAGSFFGGGVVGALGFKHVGYLATVPLALALVTVAIVPAFDDLLRAWRPWPHRR